MAGGAIASHKLAGKAATDTAKIAAQRSPEESQLMQAQTGLANQQKDQGGKLFDTAMPAIKNTLGYYGTLLSGNRAARMGAVAPEAQDVSAAYGGADKAVKRQLVGGERQTALAENARAKAGQIARLTSGVRPGAAAASGGMGMQLAGQGVNATQGAGNIFGSLVSNSTQNRQSANLLGYKAGQDTSSNIGALIANLLQQYPGGRGGSKGGSMGGYGA